MLKENLVYLHPSTLVLQHVSTGTGQFCLPCSETSGVADQLTAASARPRPVSALASVGGYTQEAL